MTEARRFPRGCVASPHYLASGAGLAVLADGGNAVDVAVATNLALGVVLPYICGYGGDLFAQVWDGERLHGYNGSGRAPAAASLEGVREAAGEDAMPGVGPLTVTVPGAVDGWFTLLERFGTRSFADLARPAIAWARNGFPLTQRGFEIIGFSKDLYTEDWAAPWQEVYGEARPHGALRQPDLARTIATLGEEGPDVYYRGPIAEAIAGAVPLMVTDDLAAHAGDWVEPLRTTYRGAEVCELPPSSQGVAALEALNLVEGSEVPERGTAEREHLLIEAMKIALADRDAHLTDPDHMTIDPAELASKAWADARRDRIDHSRAGTPLAGRAAAGGTVYLCAADAGGMLVSLIQSNYVGFGSGVTVPGWGINLQNRGGYFSLDPGHPNAVAPRKRTLHTLMPGMAFRDGAPWLVFGTMGGDGQAQTHLQLLTRMIDGSDDPQQAVSAPRWVVSPDDWTVSCESRFGGAVLAGLRERGHPLEEMGPYEIKMGHAHAIEVVEDGYAAGTDPRAEGAALGL